MKYYVTYQKYEPYFDGDREEIQSTVIDIKPGIEVNSKTISEAIQKKIGKSQKLAIVVAWSRIEIAE